MALALLGALCVTRSLDLSGNRVLSPAKGTSWNQVLSSCDCDGSGPSQLCRLLVPCFHLCTRARHAANTGPVGLIFQMQVIRPVLLGKKGYYRPGTQAVRYLSEKSAWGYVRALAVRRTLTESDFQGSA